MQQRQCGAPRAGDRELIITRVLEAPRELVWQVWTSAEHLARWWGPPGCRNADVEIDAHAGGRLSLLMHTPDGGRHVCLGTFRVVEPLHRLVLEGPEEGHPCGAGIPPRSVVTVTFEEAGEATRLTIHTSFDSASAREAAIAARYAVSWPECLERLGAYLRSADAGRAR